MPFYVTGGRRGLNTELRQQIMEALQSERDTEAILDRDIPPSAEDLAKAEKIARTAVDAVETKTGALDVSSLDSLYWMQGLSSVWSELGWSAFRNKDLATAESYLRDAWRLSQDRQSGYRLGYVLEAKGNKQAAAHQYELAHITATSGAFGKPATMDPGVDKQLDDAYKRLTGHPLVATALNNGQYEGSLRAELDRSIEVHEIIRSTKVNGTAFFMFSFAAGKPVRATLIAGDKSLNSLTATLQEHPFPSMLPAGSKAVLLREARVICSQWAGCDADFLLPTSITIPPIQIFPQVREKLSPMQLNPPPKSN